MYERFLQTDLGQLYLSIPFDQLAATLPAPKHSKSGKGCKPWFDVKGGIALQFLKHYLCLSDALLIERINTDWSMQFFCGIHLKPNEIIKDTNLPSYWRGYIGEHLDIAAMQKQVAFFWKPSLTQTTISTEDATCYESRISFPTPVKIVWDACSKTYLSYNSKRKKIKQRGSRCNYEAMHKAFLSYQKTKKKTKKAEKKLLKKLLKFLLRLLQLHKKIVEDHKILLSIKESAQMLTITTVYAQQHSKVYGAVEQIKGRIVSFEQTLYTPHCKRQRNKTSRVWSKSK